MKRPNIKYNNEPSKLAAAFYYHPLRPSAGQAIRFYDASSGSPESWLWSFGDGKTSTLRNPSHTYDMANIYYVTLQVARGSLTSFVNRNIFISSSISADSGKPSADFGFAPESPRAGEAVRFYDKSTGNPTQRLWQFGYFNFSLLKDPVRVFFSNRRYKVTLNVKNEFGSDRCSKYVDVGPLAENITIAKSCSLKDIQAAIATANPGDTVIVPNGAAVWGEQLIINKGIILKASTKGGVRITAGFEGTNYNDNNYLIKYVVSNPSANDPFRISGFIFDCDNKTEGILLSNSSTTTAVNKIRIDNNEFYNMQTDVAARVIYRRGPIYGVVDNNIFHNDDSNTYRHFSFEENTGGQYVWQSFRFDFGTADNLYYEDNTIYTRNVIVGSGAGGRYAFRHNYIIVNRETPINIYLLDIHGNMGTGQNWGSVGMEFYENSIDYNGNGTCMVDIRGGKVLVYNNTFTDLQYDKYFQVREECNDNENPPAKNLISGQPQHVSETYIFNQTNNGNKIYLEAVVSQTIDYGGEEGVVPREDVHFFREKAGFDGSSGVGVGPISQRPIFCSKEGVAWWATDENRFYRWHNGTWQVYYSPYAYPHPLRTILGD